jgi:hypothetical protein
LTDIQRIDDFKVDDLVLKWDARNEDKGKHGKFDHLWLGPFRIVVLSWEQCLSVAGAQWKSHWWRTCEWQVSQTLLFLKVFWYFHLIVNNHFYFSDRAVEVFHFNRN